MIHCIEEGSQFITPPPPIGVFYSLKIGFVLANSVDTDEIDAFYPWYFTVCKSSYFGVSRLQMVDQFMWYIGVGSFSILGRGGQTQHSQLQYLGGAVPKVHIRMRAHACTCMHTPVLNIHTHMHACTCMYINAHTSVKYSYTHACMHMHICMHAQSIQTYILHPNMKIIKIKASDLYEKTTKIIQVNEESMVIYIAYKLFESAYIYTHTLLKSKQWISIFKKPYI